MEDTQEVELASAPPATIPKMTLWQLVDQLADPQFDPEAIVGALKDKVDAIEHILSSMKALSNKDGTGWLNERVRTWSAKASTIKNNYDRLRKQIAQIMVEKEYQRLPGNEYCVVLKRSGPSVDMDRDDPTILDYDAWREAGFVSIRSYYVWNKDKIKKALENGELGPDFPGRIVRTPWPDFKLNIPEKLENKRRGKK